ncbi:MAG: PQQ-dependent sugar dehydrogenase [Solirubrobacterales bacterium]|nr:PQQ-dependent sugar dehydrogenase [Solirubrobacterales bacterium]
MKLIAAAGVALICWLGISGTALGAQLVEVTPEGFLQSDLSYMDSPPSDGRIFLAERGNSETNRASIRILDGGEPVITPFRTIDNVDVAGERGVMSIAFPPDYADSGLFYAFSIARGPDSLSPSAQRGQIRIVEYRRSADNPDLADPDYQRLVISTPHSASNHNGGWMEFGPDGYLYFSIGDNADRDRAQELNNLYGKVMRIDPADPAGPSAYTIPADNPFTTTSGARGEVWAYGFRNPYRGAFAPDGRLTIGDVGEGTWEEINAGDLKGRNMGWPDCEGFCGPPIGSFTDPVFAYNHDDEVDGFGGGCAVVGGDVVEDPSLTGLTGRYIFADFCGGVIHSLDLDTPGGDFESTGLTGYGNPVAFGTDSSNCSYMLQGNGLFRIVADETGTVACPHPVEPPPPGPLITYTSFIPFRAVIGKRFVVAAKCSIPCTATATARIKVSRNRLRKAPSFIQLKPVSRSLQPDTRTSLVFQIPAGRVPKIKRAIRNGSRVTAPVEVRMVGEDSSGGTGAKTTRFVRPKRR